MNINNINVNKYPISQMLDPESKVVFEIPKYQREYIWGYKQWEALFDDVVCNEQGYFLGSIICINIETDSLSFPKYEVVDGQQRLTTISLFLVALFDLLNRQYDTLDEEQQADVLQLKRKLVLRKTASNIRIIPQTQNNNLDDYLGLLADKNLIAPHTLPKFAGNRRILKAFYYFSKRLESETATDQNQTLKLFEILDKINSAILVMIDVANHSDAYTLFESLNNRGTPLTSIDLIKNLLLAKLEQHDKQNIDYYFARWTEILRLLGDDYTVQERFFRHNYNAFRTNMNIPFIKDDRAYPLGSIATKSTMLGIYEHIIANNPQHFIDDTMQSAFIYAQFISNNTEDLSSELRNSYLDISRVKGTPAYIMLLYVVKNKSLLSIDDHDIIKINHLLINFFVRRNLTDLPATRDLPWIFMSFIQDIEHNLYMGDTICRKLREKLLSVSVNDALFEDKLRGPVYEDNVNVTRFILCMLAKEGMTFENKIDLWHIKENNQYVWTIEHIFPQGKNIPKDWVDMIADGDVEKANEYQSLYVHTLGNLTITGYNATLGNKSFHEKKERKDSKGAFIGYRNGLNLNNDICDQEKWTIDIIKHRTDKLVSKALDLFRI